MPPEKRAIRRQLREELRHKGKETRIIFFSGKSCAPQLGKMKREDLLVYSNVNSLKNEIDDFECMFTEEEPDIIGLTEAWMKEASSIKVYHPVIRHARDKDKKGEV